MYTLLNSRHVVRIQSELKGSRGKLEDVSRSPVSAVQTHSQVHRMHILQTAAVFRMKRTRVISEAPIETVCVEGGASEISKYDDCCSYVTRSILNVVIR